MDPKGKISWKFSIIKKRIDYLTGLSEKLSEVASRDVVYLSLKQVTPRRRARPAKETLLSIEPAQSLEHHRFSLHVDRRTKRGA